MVPPGAVAKHQQLRGSGCKEQCIPSGRRRITPGLTLLEQPIAFAEFMVVDTETNGLGGEACELTEVAGILVGGGELHERWGSLVRTVAPLTRGVQRFTGVTQEMVDVAPEPALVLAELERRLRGRVLVAHNAAFDRRVLRQAFARADLQWPEPPVLCTAALARTLLPLQRERRLAPLAQALGIEVAVSHRALPDAETCARILCALFPRLCANSTTVEQAVGLLSSRRRRRRQTRGGAEGAIARSEVRSTARQTPSIDFAQLPRDPGVYLFRDDAGRTLYVGKSISIRSRARAHFAPSAAGPRAGAAPAPGGPPETPVESWRAHAAVVDYRATNSELGALVLENRLIKQLRPPGNVRLVRPRDGLLYIRCRFDIPFPILEVGTEPASGHAITIGPLRGRRLALELVEQLDSLFGLRHCGRRLPRRDHPSAYGQMGRCLSPCLGDLDPNLYRGRLDAALRIFVEGPDAREGLIAHVESQMRDAAGTRRYERAAWLRRRVRRLSVILGRLEGVLEATHARPRLVVARHPAAPRMDALWLLGGRLVDWGPLPDLEELERRTRAALVRAAPYSKETGTHVPRDEVDEVRIVCAYLASHPQTPQLALERAPGREELARFVASADPSAGAQPNGSSSTSAPTSPVPTATADPGGASRRTSASAIGP